MAMETTAKKGKRGLAAGSVVNVFMSRERRLVLRVRMCSLRIAATVDAMLEE
jgi:hypothetical protein